ncbi:MAG: T9SS type A sorting domain-containing protein, partial [Balneolales bacterium]|nr:T9SS type A sorting domain-containing protein [Balneolales bacterium]
NHQSHIVVEFWGIEEFGPTYTFSMYGTDNLETLEANVLLKFVDDQIPLIGHTLRFEDDLGLRVFNDLLDGGPDNKLKGSYINGELVGDTTFYYATSIEFEPGIPTEFELGAYPNPFNPTTQIRFELPLESEVELGVYTVTGRLITTLVNEVRPAGTHNVSFDASDLASGVYIYRIRAGDFIQTRKMTLVK